MSKLDLEQLLTDLKLKHRAEIDAIMLEQGIYKRIIQQMIQKFKEQQKKLDSINLKLIKH